MPTDTKNRLNDHIIVMTSDLIATNLLTENVISDVL